MEKNSRRDLLKMGAGAAVVAVVGAGTAMAETLPTSDDIEKQLGHPLPDEAKKLLKAALEANAKNGSDRLAHKLPEGSEPCFTFAVKP